MKLADNHLLPKMNSPIKRITTAHNQHLIEELNEEHLTGSMGSGEFSASICGILACMLSAPDNAN